MHREACLLRDTVVVCFSQLLVLRPLSPGVSAFHSSYPGPPFLFRYPLTLKALVTPEHRVSRSLGPTDPLLLGIVLLSRFLSFPSHQLPLSCLVLRVLSFPGEVLSCHGVPTAALWSAVTTMSQHFHFKDEGTKVSIFVWLGFHSCKFLCFSPQPRSWCSPRTQCGLGLLGWDQQAAVSVHSAPFQSRCSCSLVKTTIAGGWQSFGFNFFSQVNSHQYTHTVWWNLWLSSSGEPTSQSPQPFVLHRRRRIWMI